MIPQRGTSQALGVWKKRVPLEGWSLQMTVSTLELFEILDDGNIGVCAANAQAAAQTCICRLESIDCWGCLEPIRIVAV